jgi:hypothetical protein
LRTCSWGNLRETETVQVTQYSHTLLQLKYRILNDFVFFQRVIILNEEEDAEGRKVANSVQVKVRNIYFPSLWYTASITLQRMSSWVQKVEVQFPS